MLITGHYWDNKSPKLWNVEEMSNEDFKITVIADITCDINGSVPSTVRSSTIDEPNYGYSPLKGEVDMLRDDAIAVMAVDNLPCELSKDASEDFGSMFIDRVLPLFENDDKNILDNANMCKNGSLRDRYSYLQDYVNSAG
jgi:saccharopine dehydrogenase (NAD+, L-lysine forming)